MVPTEQFTLDHVLRPDTAARVCHFDSDDYPFERWGLVVDVVVLAQARCGQLRRAARTSSELLFRCEAC